STGCWAVTAKQPDWALTWTSVTADSCETASRTDASHPPQVIPRTTNSLVCISRLLSGMLATILYTPIGYISMDGFLGILLFQQNCRGGITARSEEHTSELQSRF